VQSRNDGGSVLRHLTVGEAQDPEAAPLQLGVPTAVRFESRAVPVMPEAIGLDDQCSVAPQKIDLVWPESRIHLGPGKAVAPTEAKEDTFKLAAREVGIAAKVAVRNQSEVKRTSDGPTEFPLGDGAVKIIEGSHGAGERHAVATGRNTGDEGEGSVDPHAGAALAAGVVRNRYLDRSPARGKYSPQRGRAAVAHHGPLSDCQSRREAATLEAEPSVPDCVNTAM
jgi:hypothetical protein